MGGPEGGLASVNDTEWLSEVRAGRKKAAVLRDAEKLFQVCTHVSCANFILVSGAYVKLTNTELSVDCPYVCMHKTCLHVAIAVPSMCSAYTVRSS